LNFEAFNFFGSHRNEPEGDHEAEDNVKRSLKGCGIGDESVQIGGGFGEDEPVTGHDKKEIKHPKGPNVNELEEKEEG
jgi:hypothetical protein